MDRKWLRWKAHSAEPFSDSSASTMKLLDLQNEFYRPLWIRVALLTVLFLWAIVEFFAGALIWGFLFVALAIIALWQWFVADWPQPQLTKDNHNPKSDG